MKVDREVWEEYLFKPGEYLCFVEIDWVTPELNDFVLSSYGACEVTFTRDERSDHPNFLEQVYMSCAKKHGKLTTFENEGAENCKKYSQMCGEGYGYTYFENDSAEASIKETVTYTRFEGLELVKPFSGSGYDVLVPPGQRTIVLMR